MSTCVVCVCLQEKYFVIVIFFLQYLEKPVAYVLFRLLSWIIMNIEYDFGTIKKIENEFPLKDEYFTYCD